MNYYSFSPLETRQVWLLGIFPARSDEPIYGKLDVVCLEDYRPDNKHGQSFEALSYTAREWFSRSWNVQEFVLAREIVFYCGQHTLDWRQLVAVTADFDPLDQTTLWALPKFTEMRHGTGMQRFFSSGHLRCTRILQQTPEGTVFLAKLQINRTWRQLSSPSFIDLLHHFQSCECRLGRDRYLALAQLATDVVARDRASLRPDYTISLRELILHYSRFVIGTAKGSEMFIRSCLWLQQQSDLPTWLEVFTQLSNCQIDISVTNQTDNAAGHTEFVVTFDHDVPNSITIGACLVEEVVDVTSLTGAKELSLDAILAHVKADAHTIERTRQRLPGLYKDDLDVAQVSVMVMCAATYEGPMLDSMVIDLELLRLCSMLPEGSRDWKAAGRALSQQSWWSDAIEVSVERFPIAIEEAVGGISAPLIQDLRVAATGKGILANVPAITLPGDEIWIVQGCRLPVVLRRSETFPMAYRLVESCYCHGVMNGEVLKRPNFRWTKVILH